MHHIGSHDTRVTLALVLLYRAVQLWGALLAVSDRIVAGTGRAALRILRAALPRALARVACLQRR